MILTLNPNSVDDYRMFLRVKSLPVYRVTGREVWFPDDYSDRLGLALPSSAVTDYQPSPFCFDYQRDIAALAIRKRKFAIFADCGLGKTIIYFEYLRSVMSSLGKAKGALILSPAMVVDQTLEEYARWYPDGQPIERIESRDLQSWLATCGGKIGITNYEALRNDVDRGQLGALVLDESSLLKSHYGRYGGAAIQLGKGLEWKLAGTGTPAPNDRIEYANHAVFLDHFPTVNSFLAKYFVNRGQTQERWVLRPHALEAFYSSLSHWCIFLTNPGVYGWKDNCEALPPIRVNVHDIEMTPEQHGRIRMETGSLFASRVGGITKRSTLSRIAKGLDGTPTLKYSAIQSLLDDQTNRSTIIWCWFNDEQDRLAAMLPDAASIDGSTPHAKRLDLIHDFKAGRRRHLISKAKVLGFGLNLQIATRHIFSSLIDSYEAYYQCIKRSNRYGSTEPLDVEIPMMECERPMVENVLRKAKLVQRDTEQQEMIFRAARDGESVAAVVQREGINLDSFTGDE
jgi:superfamily II DNA or RNA helicase